MLKRRYSVALKTNLPRVLRYHLRKRRGAASGTFCFTRRTHRNTSQRSNAQSRRTPSGAEVRVRRADGEWRCVSSYAARRFRLMKSLFATDYAETLPVCILAAQGSPEIWGVSPIPGIEPDARQRHWELRSRVRRGTPRSITAHFPDGRKEFGTPFFPGVGRPPGELRTFDLKDDPRSRSVQPLISNLIESEWTIFDLRPLRQLINERPGIIDSDLATLIFGIDMIVMIPEATPSTPLR